MPPADGDERRLDDELADDVGLFRAERAPQADLRRPLEHARQHDVHDADAADEQRDRGERHHHDVEDPLGALLFGEELGRDDERVVVGGAVRGGQDAADCRGRRRDVHVWLQPQIDAVDLVAERAVVVLEAEHGCAGRHVDQVVAILAGHAGDVALHDGLRSGDANHLKPLLVHLDELADRIGRDRTSARAPPRRARTTPRHAPTRRR